MFNIKALKIESISSALKKAERYRFLNESKEAESICLDILQIEPNNQDALIMMLLVSTDQFKTKLYPAFDDAKKALETLDNDYSKRYYCGVIYERRAKAALNLSTPENNNIAYDWFIKAMNEYERAMESNTNGNQDAILRWNTCARILNENPKIKPNDESREVEFIDAYE